MTSFADSLYMGKSTGLDGQSLTAFAREREKVLNDKQMVQREAQKLLAEVICLKKRRKLPYTQNSGAEINSQNRGTVTR